ncbi:Copper amine oxidase N-terminal domain-containing protein [Desulforamulus putei DSM 12395]|uniref:Copper amine oxidase N-terminal domain-containing protein n=1 Tax=Desulforamulus putei DSM 12395 TaxID=1121429 RepID=A0A1M4ZEN2_9FIRM|nr:stalk domain-containing protein [Desulforamulus putei]SHF16451.1 Copper amine oxidase N-terminal domain-containing protein [Desulforamulus putei DSM 12395]
MKLFKNMKKIAAVGVLSFGLILGMFTGQALACDKCKDLHTVVKVNDNGLVYEVDVWENIKWAESKGYIKEEDVFKEFENSLRGAASEMATVYPKYELLEIDGKPWQLTPYAEMLKKELFYADKQYTEPSKWVGTPMEELFLDPSLNGKGKEVIALVEAGKTAAEIKALLGKPEVKEPPVQDNQGKIETEPQEPAVTEARPDSLVLTVGKKEYSEVKDGLSRPALLDTEPIVLNGVTLVPLRGVVDKLGAEITWDGGTKIEVVKGDKKVNLTLNSDKAFVNDQEYTLASPAVVRGGRTLIPLRFVSEGLGLTVNWDSKTQSIIIR